jgi:hypothetical protein
MTRHITFQTVSPRPDARRGVALLIVVGLLGLLLISSVAFSILMRTERSGASNFHHTTAARQMLQTALARAIEDIDLDVGNSVYPAWTNATLGIIDPAFPERRDRDRQISGIRPEVLFSVDETVTFPNTAFRAHVLSTRAMQYVPRSLKQAVETAQPEWIPVEIDGRNVGRYAYVAANVSGLLDANLVEDARTNRWMGADPGEMRIATGAQSDVVNTNTFVSDRRNNGRYVTLGELAALNTGIDSNVLSNFEVFSYAMEELQPDGRTPKIDISSLAKIKAQKRDINAAFVACGLSPEKAMWAYQGLVDYVDTDSVPVDGDDLESDDATPLITDNADARQRFERPCTEAVPLVQQTQVRMQYMAAPNGDGTTTHTMRYLFEIGLCYPFQKVTGGGVFTIQGEIYAGAMADEEEYQTWNDLTPPSPADGSMCHSFTRTITVPGPNMPMNVAFPDENITLDPPPLQMPTAGGKAKLHFAVMYRIRIKDSLGNVVHQVPSDWSLNAEGYPQFARMLTIKRNYNTEPANVEAGDAYWSEAIDPRMNYDCMTDAPAEIQWFDSRHTVADGNLGPALDKLGTLDGSFAGYTVADDTLRYVNDAVGGSLTRYVMDNPRTLSSYFKFVVDGIRNGDGDAFHDPVENQLRCHVANAKLQSVGELGYLPINRWLTLSLYDHKHADSYGLLPTTAANVGMHPVLDYFTLRSPTTVLRGRVNLNTRNPEVMAAVFQDLPLDTETGRASHRIPARAYDAATRACDGSGGLARWLLQKGGFTRISDLGRIWRDTGHLSASDGASAGALAVTEPAKLLERSCLASGPGITFGAFGEFEREAVIRNACNLLTTRQQIYTIILRADSFVPRFGMTDVREGNVLATAQAVAQIWRDPVATDVGGGVRKHKCYVQLFKLLDE